MTLTSAPPQGPPWTRRVTLLRLTYQLMKKAAQRRWQATEDPLRTAQDSVSTGHHGPQPAGRPTGGAQEWRLNNNINSQDITPSGDRCNNLISPFAPFPFFNF